MPKYPPQSPPVFADEWAKWEDRVSHIVYDVMVRHPEAAPSTRACSEYNRFKKDINEIVSRGSVLGGKDPDMRTPVPDRWTPVKDALLRYVFDHMSTRIRHHGLIAEPEDLAEKIRMLDNQLCNHGCKQGKTGIWITEKESQQIATKIVDALNKKITKKFGTFVPHQESAAARVLRERAGKTGLPDLP